MLCTEISVSFIAQITGMYGSCTSCARLLYTFTVYYKKRISSYYYTHNNILSSVRKTNKNIFGWKRIDVSGLFYIFFLSFKYFPDFSIFFLTRTHTYTPADGHKPLFVFTRCECVRIRTTRVLCSFDVQRINSIDLNEIFFPYHSQGQLLLKTSV